MERGGWCVGGREKVHIHGKGVREREGARAVSILYLNYLRIYIDTHTLRMCHAAVCVIAHVTHAHNIIHVTQ